jgi:flagellar capping protein FliD
MKIEEQELEKIKSDFNKTEQMAMQIASLELQKTRLMKDYAEVIESANKTRAELEEKYGPISIDMSDGSYTKPVENGTV